MNENFLKRIIMKKTILKLSFVIAVIAAAGYTAYESQTSNELNGLALDNVEAIASGENSMCPNGCMGSGDGCYCNGWYPYLREA